MKKTWFYQRRYIFQTRGRLGENYEEPVSGREAWWRCTIKVYIL